VAAARSQTARPQAAFLERANLLGLRALLALTGSELDPLVLLETTEPIGLDGRVVHENVRAAVIWCDESVTLA
jgi:hypothetical protein